MSWFSTAQDNQKPEDDPEQEQDASTNDSDEQTEGEQSDEESTNQRIEGLELQCQDLELDVAKYKDALARSQAEQINIQNMNRKDVENAKKFASKGLATDLLKVADSLDACLDAIENQDAKISVVVEGVKLTQGALMNSFQRNGINRIESLHKEFDPNFHEALFKMPTDEHAPDTVVQVVSQGYTINDAVLRAARVGVSVEAPPAPGKDTE